MRLVQGGIDGVPDTPLPHRRRQLDEFVDAWKAGVVPLRERFGFRFHGAWPIAESSEFVWVISHDGEEGLAAADITYYESEERRQLSPDPAVHVVSSQVDVTDLIL